jgi:hypothetical protein
MPSSKNNRPSLSHAARFGMILILALAWNGTPVHASDASNPAAVLGGFIRGVVGLPVQIVGAITQGLSKAAAKAAKKDTAKQ